ncbi:hypothetical protein EV421DRAFT_149427 [Armillaria borealis]|uniref:Uncharacterized protein n=1 Tax=Armillaria borealis TaxID=47425 RepID=A0AA39MUJ3_9AGAR|nr:hypothetical protein EV421DRAFT_149427 [Armillaria borealis]
MVLASFSLAECFGKLAPVPLQVQAGLYVYTLLMDLCSSTHDQALDSSVEMIGYRTTDYLPAAASTRHVLSPPTFHSRLYSKTSEERHIDSSAPGYATRHSIYNPQLNQQTVSTSCSATRSPWIFLLSLLSAILKTDNISTLPSCLCRPTTRCDGIRNWPMYPYVCLCPPMYMSHQVLGIDGGQ